MNGANRLALITGASAGLGAEFARQYAAKGWDVALTARRADRLDRLAREIEETYKVATLVITLTMTMLWKTKEAILNSVFSLELPPLPEAADEVDPSLN